MTGTPHDPSHIRHSRGQRKVLELSAWLYGLLLHAYPIRFRHQFGERMLRVFQDSCRVALQQQGILSLVPLWLHTTTDLLLSASIERWQAYKERIGIMATVRDPQQLPPRLWIAFAVTLLAFVGSLVASLNLYLLEDSSSLTQAAYSASPLLRFSYDGIYLSALAAGVSALLAIAYVLVGERRSVPIGFVLVTLLVAFGGFGGMLVRHPATFAVLLAIFLLLTLGSFLPGRLVARKAGESMGTRPAAVLGACVSVGSVLLINVVGLVLHTLILNPVSHALYMQGEINGTHLNFTLLIMVLAFCTLLACIVCVGRALRLPVYRT